MKITVGKSKAVLWMVCGMAGILLSGCAEQSAGTHVTQNQSELEQQLAAANEEVRHLKQSNAQLSDTIGQLKQTTNVMATEKTARVVESSSLRGQVRHFIQNNIDQLKNFMVQGDILDYVGNEQVPRSRQDTKSGVFIVDFANAMPSSGVITGVGGQFTRAGTVKIKVLHPVQGQHVVIWESKPLQISAPGRQQAQFPVSVGVEKGDVIGYYFSDVPNVGYDIGAGETLYDDGDVALGRTVSKAIMSGADEKRAYSLGVYGLLDSNN